MLFASILQQIQSARPSPHPPPTAAHPTNTTTEHHRVGSPKPPAPSNPHETPDSLDEQALEALYQRLERPLYNVLYRRVWNADDARELLQEAFMRLWNMRARVDIQRVEPLIWRIALNLASKHRRKQKLWQWVGLSSAPTLPDHQHDPLTTLSNTEDLTRLRDAIDALPKKHRDVILLCAYGEMNYTQVGAMLNIAPGTVGSRRNTALKLLRSSLQRGPS